MWCVSQVYSSNVLPSSGPLVVNSEVLSLLALLNAAVYLMLHFKEEFEANLLNPLCFFTFFWQSTN